MKPPSSPSPDQVLAPPGWIIGQPFPKPEAAEYIVKKGSGFYLGQRLALGWRPRAAPGAYWHWLSRWGNPRTLVLRFALWIWVFGIIWAVACLFGLLPWTVPPLASGMGYYWAAYFLAIGCGMVGSKTKLHFARHVLENEGLVCFDCGYLLHGLPDEHRCPECNAPYEKKSLQERWLQWMKDPKQP